MLKNYEWTTEETKTKIEIVIETITQETISLDGHKFVKELDHPLYYLNELKINDKKATGDISYDTSKIHNIYNKNLSVLIPANIKLDIKKTEKPIVTIKNENVYNNNVCPKCGTYCYGDCETN